MARRNNLLVEPLEDELVLYDKDRDHGHVLNPTAALVWRHCDGRASIAEIAASLKRELDLPADEAVVWLALNQLDRAHLLQEPLTRPPLGMGVSRRQILRKLGRGSGAALLLPVVTSILAPTPVQAFSF